MIKLLSLSLKTSASVHIRQLLSIAFLAENEKKEMEEGEDKMEKERPLD